MHVSGFSLDPYWFLRFIFSAFLIFLGILHLVKSTASKYFIVDTNFDEGGSTTTESRRRSQEQMFAVAVAGGGDGCTVCGGSANKKCSGCKAVRYCSEICQSKHWRADHKFKCKDFKILGTSNSTGVSSCGGEASIGGGKSSTELQLSKKVLFPYDEFVKLFNWDKPGFPPCGLLNCGNSCFANVVLQCLSCTRPLIAYLLEKGHRGECRRNDWCFFCELQIHVERARQNLQPFSPMNILSRLPNIGGNLGYGKQEDAHEFMRFAIDTMQSVCLDEFGGEKTLHPSSQETSLIQYIFGGHLQSQVKCTKCNKISYRYENMMDLTVEIQGDAASLEDCLDLFTAKEWLDGENMYKCEGCNDYVKACKRLTIHQAPNILTIALKRFQGGRFGKLNKRVTFPETLDLGPYMSDPGEGTDLYQLYSVVVHVDMLNASFFGHYICYTKDFSGNWYRIDDCKVATVELEEVLSQGAYMLLYSRTHVRPCVRPLETSREEEQQPVEVVAEAQPCSRQSVESITIAGPINSFVTHRSMPSDISSDTQESIPKKEDLVVMDLDDPVMVNSKFTGEDLLDADLDNLSKVNSWSRDPLHTYLGDPIEVNLRSAREDPQDLDFNNPDFSSSNSEDHVSKFSQAAEIAASPEIVRGGIPTCVPLEHEVSGTSSDLQFTFEDVNEARSNYDKGLMSMECSVDGCLESGSDLHEMAETSSNLPAATQNTESKTSKLGGARTFCPEAKLKPLFSPGFLDKGMRYRSLNSNGKMQGGRSESSLSRKVSSSSSSHSNGFIKPGFPDQNSSKVNGHNGTLDFGDASTPSFIKEQSEKCLNGDDEMANIQFGGDCGSKSSHIAEIASPAMLMHIVGSKLAPVSDDSSLIEAQNLEPELSGTKFDVRCGFVKENGVGSSCSTEFTSSNSKMDGTLSNQNDDHEMTDTEIQSSKETVENSCSRGKSIPNPLLCSGFLYKHLIEEPLKRNEEAKEPSEVCKAKGNCNGFAKSGSLHQINSEVNGHVGVINSTSLLTSPSFIKKQSINSLNEDGVDNQGLNKVANPWHFYSNGDAESALSKENKICNNLVGNGKSVFSPGFIDKPLRKKSLNNDGTSHEVSGSISSLHDRTKLPRVG